MRASMKRHGTPAHHRKQHASRLKRRVLLVVLLLLFILCGPLITHPRRRETRRGGARNMHFTLQGRLAFTPVEPTQPLQHQYQHQHHQAMSAGAKESRNGGQHALSEGLELPVGHHNAEGLFASHTCKAANDNDAKDGTIVRVLFRRSRCRRWGPEGTQDGVGTECNEVSRPIVELSPRASAAAYFPEEALADEADGYKRPSQLRSVVTEEEEEE
ncbi:hypothetical protein DQ04_05221010, partial [Trypanosoma grayi]|uniref:hypothetical protein n=1 Tax=Trypanosoma grayi TaxID=71804 RepID=UPI0004F400FC